MSATSELEKWYQDKRSRGEVVDIKFAPLSPDTSLEKLSKAVLETVTGKREMHVLDTSKL